MVDDAGKKPGRILLHLKMLVVIAGEAREIRDIDHRHRAGARRTGKIADRKVVAQQAAGRNGPGARDRYRGDRDGEAHIRVQKRT